jgi:hypothetical protein
MNTTFDKLPDQNGSASPKSGLRGFWEKLSRKRRATTEKTVWQMSPDDLSDRFSFEIVRGNPNQKTMFPIQEKLVGFIEVKDWMCAADLIEDFDSARTTLPSGTRLMRPLLENIWQTYLMRALPLFNLESTAPVTLEVLPDSHLKQFKEAAETYPDRVGLQVLAAWMHLEMAWARRGGEYVVSTDETAIDGFEQNIDAAWQLIKDIDADLEDSPLAAEILYRCEASSGISTRNEVEQVHAKWVALDPTDMGAFSLHGIFMLPRWYGSYEQLAEAAENAHATHRKDVGLAAYAAMFLGAMGVDQAAMSKVNPLQLQDGLLDMIAQAEAPCAALNAVCAHLSDICNTKYTGADGVDDNLVLERKAAMHVIVRKFIRRAMGTVTPAIWTPQWSELEVPYLLAEAFENEIMSGQRVHLDHTGATISPA